ncbi:hypothetical protein LTR64_002968 [Lithohypha guttulata]|uniref:uncharacterized protein n=1 Tax=Lithohypha guttulata TaxID=1690604 RepID=UPI00315DDBA6
MDAAAEDADVKLYKASAELLGEFRAKLPLLLKSLKGNTRRLVLHHKTNELLRLEWPQLLDPVLGGIVHSLAESFLACTRKPDVYYQNVTSESDKTEPVPRAICRILYTLCKVRGYKVIVRLLNNEPKYIEPLLECFSAWDQPQNNLNAGMSWEERYILFLWLSHLMLAPFELSTISGSRTSDISIPTRFQDLKLPHVGLALLNIALRYLCVPGKDREAASLLIVRLALRKDMQKLSLPDAAVQWCTNGLFLEDGAAPIEQYRCVGLLTLLYGLINSASSSEALPFLEQSFNTCKWFANGSSSSALSVRQSAPSRKLIVKMLRASILHAVVLSDSGQPTASQLLDGNLEDTIQILLEWLADTDTPVRQVASKSLSLIVLKLENTLASDIIEAILDCLNENMLLEDLRTGSLAAATDMFDVDPTLFKKNVNAVNPLKWHGAMLTLGHLLFRRSPPVEQLTSILEALLMGLTFEQRSSVGTSLGVGVRDAACFGIWSLARKYSTREMATTILSTSFLASRPYGKANRISTLQIVAVELVLASCLDPSGNIRRGASAALQELIGRHPDTIKAGIPVVQEVDYHSVARRARAISAVAQRVACLDETYHISLLYALLDWRGCRAVDADSRRQAAGTIGSLFLTAKTEHKTKFAEQLTSQIADLKPSNLGVNAAARHGLLLTLSSLFEIWKPGEDIATEVQQILRRTLDSLEHITGSLTGRTTADLVHIFEATARVIAAWARSGLADRALLQPVQSSPVFAILDRCTIASEDDSVAAAAADANQAVFSLVSLDTKGRLLDLWLPSGIQGQKSVFTSHGRIATMGKIFPLIVVDSKLSHHSFSITKFLNGIVVSELQIETRVNAMQAIATIQRSNIGIEARCMHTLNSAIFHGLSDYTNDQRGDIGSLLRLSSIEAVQSINSVHLKSDSMRRFIRVIARLAAERLAKVRFAAWNCLQVIWTDADLDFASKRFAHQADVSSFAYFSEIAKLFSVRWLHDDLLTGFVSSIGTADDVSQNASSALVSNLVSMTADARLEHLQHIMDVLLSELTAASGREDREVVPLLDTLCLLLEQFPIETEAQVIDQKSRIMSLVSRLQTSIADIPRIQSLIRLVSHLALIQCFKNEALDILSRKLLHKWPKIRQYAADAIYLLEPQALPTTTNWNSAPLANKGEVVQLRKKLGVAGQAAAAVKA